MLTRNISLLLEQYSSISKQQKVLSKWLFFNITNNVWEESFNKLLHVNSLPRNYKTQPESDLWIRTRIYFLNLIL